MLQNFRKFQYTFKNVLKSNYLTQKRKFGLWKTRVMAFSTDNGRFKIGLERYNDIENRSHQSHLDTNQLFTQVSSLQKLVSHIRFQQESNLQIFESLQGYTHQQKIVVTKLIQNLNKKTIKLEKALIEQSKLIESSALSEQNIQQLNLLRQQSQSIEKLLQKIVDSFRLLIGEKRDKNLVKILQFMEKSKSETEKITRRLKNASLQINQSLINTNQIIIRLQKQNQQLLNILNMYQKQEKDRQKVRQEEIKKYNDRQESRQRQRQEQKQRQKDRQEKRQKQRKKNMVFRCLGGIASLLVIYKQGYEPWIKEKEFRNKYRKLPIVRYEYVKGSQVQKQLNKIFSEYKQAQIKMIVGPQGTGKTSTLREILKHYENQGKQFFYFTFQSSTSQDNCIKSADQLLKMLQMVRQLYKSSDYKNKEVKIVIDDINKIDYLENQQYFKKIMTQMYGFAYSQSIDLICLSSSSTFVEKFNKNNQYKKSVRTYIIQSEHTQEFTHKFLRMKLEEQYRKTLKKELKKDESFWEDFKTVSKQIFSFGFNLRFIQLELCPLISSRLNKMEEVKGQGQISEILKQIKSIQSMEQYFDLLEINNIMKINFKNVQDSKKMIRKVLQKQTFQLKNCLSVLQVGPEPQKIQRAILQLNQQNLIMFCRPRTKKERAAFEKFLKNKVQ